MNRKTSVLSVAVTAALITFVGGCGGGGGGGGEGSQQGSMTVFSGTVATGLPVSSQPVSVTCKAGTISSTVTGSDGSYSLSTTDKPPCVFAAQLSTNELIHSLATEFGTVNITPFTELGYQLAKGDPNNLDTAKATLKLSAARDLGVVIEGDPFTTPFSANRMGADYEIERFVTSVNKLYPPPSDVGIVGSLRQYAEDVLGGTSPPALNTPETSGIKAWLINVAVGTLSFLDESLPDSYVVGTAQYDNQPDFIRIVGSFGADTWNFLVALPVEAMQQASDNLTNSLGKLGHRDSLTGKIVWDTSAFGGVAWDTIKVAAAGIGGTVSPGKIGGALCATINDVSGGGAEQVGYEDHQAFCSSVASISDIFFSAKDFVGNASDVGIAISKFKTSWLSQYNNNTALMKIARMRSLDKLFKGSFSYAVSISDSNDAFSVNNLNAIRTQYAELLMQLGFTSDEVNDSLQTVACPTGTSLNATGECEAPAAQSEFSVAANAYPGVGFTNPFASRPASCTATATGTWNNGPTAYYGPDGLSGSTCGSTCRLSSAPSVSLIMMRGDGSGEFIGSARAFSLATGETVTFSNNDNITAYQGQPNAYFDNQGSMNVKVLCN